eukprot:76672-Ditylum_brightwellii.AAC.1
MECPGLLCKHAPWEMVKGKDSLCLCIICKGKNTVRQGAKAAIKGLKHILDKISASNTDSNASNNSDSESNSDSDDASDASLSNGSNSTVDDLAYDEQNRSSAKMTHLVVVL